MENIATSYKVLLTEALLPYQTSVAVAVAAAASTTTTPVSSCCDAVACSCSGVAAESTTTLHSPPLQQLTTLPSLSSSSYHHHHPHHHTHHHHTSPNHFETLSLYPCLSPSQSQDSPFRRPPSEGGNFPAPHVICNTPSSSCPLESCSAFSSPWGVTTSTPYEDHTTELGDWIEDWPGKCRPLLCLLLSLVLPSLRGHWTSLQITATLV